MIKPKKIRKLYEKRDWDKLVPNGKPKKTDLSGVKSAYAYAKKAGIRIVSEKQGDVYMVWRLK